jgi:hypothetical protein
VVAAARQKNDPVGTTESDELGLGGISTPPMNDLINKPDEWGGGSG